MGPAPVKPPVILSRDEVRDLLRAASGSPRDHAILSTLYFSGMRVSECAGLQVGNWDRSTGLLTFYRPKRRDWHAVPVMPALEATLGRWLNVRRISRETSDNPYPTAPMWPSRQGGALAKRTLQRIMERHCKDAGIPRAKAHCHLLRHSIGSHLLDATGDLWAVKALLGHSDIRSSTTYLHVSGQYVRDALERL